MRPKEGWNDNPRLWGWLRNWGCILKSRGAQGAGGMDMTRSQCELKPFGWRNRKGLKAAYTHDKQDKRSPNGITDA